MNIELLKKVLDKLVFKPQNIEYSLHIEGPSPYRREELVVITIFVDMSRFVEGSKNFDKNYGNDVYNIGNLVDNALSLISIPPNNIHISIEYVNDGEFNDELGKMTLKLKELLSDKNIMTYNEFDDNDISFYYYGSESDNPYIRVEVSGYGIDNDVLSEVIDSSFKVFDESKYYNVFDLDYYFD